MPDSNFAFQSFIFSNPSVESDRAVFLIYFMVSKSALRFVNPDQNS